MEVKADKKLLTVLFPDGRDGRAFTLKVLPPFKKKKTVFFALLTCRTTSKIGQIMSNLNYDDSFNVIIIASQILLAFHTY